MDNRSTNDCTLTADINYMYVSHLRMIYAVAPYRKGKKSVILVYITQALKNKLLKLKVENQLQKNTVPSF